ncbi:zinc-ribbon domain and TM2 domain-containing protein [Methanolobus profundi]|uniref:TM2 domain-containing membrane protein YozV n=1 Tax=Methanolobus profundi TaxID=487685 RepID=A0A1I4R454_9EURY|nr:TM2 domain-containing protein [Methanolobus profundi]SFM46915.1 TM2 domain-containing membrane protein YozV [Methanolobus profundi]
MESYLSSIDDNKKFCTKCGAIILKEAEVCPQCGVRQPRSYADHSGKSRKDKTAAGLLAIFLGGLGAHKFYLNNSGAGLLYLCFFWTYIPALLGLVEGILFLTMSNEEFDRKYN